MPLDALAPIAVDDGDGNGATRAGPANGLVTLAADAPDGLLSTRASRLGLLIVGLVPLIANLPAIVGIVSYQPLLNTSGLGVIARKGFIPGQPFIDPNVGYNSQAIGHAAALAWLHGHVPWWNLNDGLGMPLAASVQSASFLPLTLLQAFSGGSLWFHIVIEMIAGVATYALLRQLRCSPFAAAAGGIAFGLNGAIAWITNAPANPVPFLPVCLLGIEYVVSAAGRKRLGGWILLALGVWLSVVAGFPEVAVMNAGLVAAWFILRLVQRWPDRLGILVRGAFGVGVGFLLAAPILNVFVRYLHVANVGIHKYPLASLTLPSASLAQTVSPYLFGGILDSPDPTVFESWTRMGGYVGATVIVLAIGSMWGRRERALRIVLAAWVLLFFGSNFDVPVLHWIVKSIPGLTHLAVYRYDTASLLLCLCLLAGFCLDDLRGLDVVAVAKRLVPGIVVVVVFFAVGFLSTSSGRAWAQLHVPRWYWGSIGLFVLVVGALVLAVVLALANHKTAVAVVLGAVLAVEAFGYFEVPILAWPRQATVDTAPIAFLRTHLGVQRYFSTGPAAPNYGAYYGIPSLGASDLPVPKSWARYVNATLSPCILPWQLGNGGPVAGCPITPVIASMAYVTGYEDAGVKYLMVGHRTHLAMFMQPEVTTGPPTPDGGVQIVIHYGPPAYFHTGTITKLMIPMPGGPPPNLGTTVCSEGRCVGASLAGPGVSGQVLALAAPLTLGDGVTITLTGSNTTPVHVLTVPGPPGNPPIYASSVVADGKPLQDCTPTPDLCADRQALVTFVYEASSIPELVKSTPEAHIYLLPHPSPIATAPGCAVHAHTMTTFTVRCTRAATLTYRELSFKGWRATVGGQDAAIATASNGVFQEVAVPAGTSTVVFTYEPPRALLAWLAVLIGVLAIGVSLVRRRRPRLFAWWPWTTLGDAAVAPTGAPAPTTTTSPSGLEPALGHDGAGDGTAQGRRAPPG